jgi:hypothetical protein
MRSIEKCPAPTDTMLKPYFLMNGAYTDCYVTGISRRVSFPEYVLAFYTTPLFKLERLILKFTVSKPSTDVQAGQLADGEIEKFAAWTVESRSDNEILMCDFSGRTRSWLMVKDNGEKTNLYFGSAVVPKTGKPSLDVGFRALLGFHKIYSVLLLYSAQAGLNGSPRRGDPSGE